MFATELPELYNSYKQLLMTTLFGEEGKDKVNPGEEEQMEFTKKFYDDLEEEKVHQKGKGKGCQGCKSLLTYKSSRGLSGVMGEEVVE